MAEDKEPERKKLSLQGNNKLSLGSTQEIIKNPRNSLSSGMRSVQVETRRKRVSKVSSSSRNRIKPGHPPSTPTGSPILGDSATIRPPTTTTPRKRPNLSVEVPGGDQSQGSLGCFSPHVCRVVTTASTHSARRASPAKSLRVVGSRTRRASWCRTRPSRRRPHGS